MKKIIILTFIAVICISPMSIAQDVHFSQIQNTPLLHNPSFAGKSGGDVRAIVNYRSQWGSVTSNQFQSFGADIDMRFKSNEKGNYFAGGLSMYSDAAGASKMRKTMINLALAAHIKINTNNYISGGIQAGLYQKSMDISDLRFDSQFEGTGHNPALDSHEDLSSHSELSPTVSGGISYMWSNAFNQESAKEGKKRFNIGLAIHHYNSPRFYFSPSHHDDIGFKYVVNFNGSFGLPFSPWTIQPAAYLAMQNRATDIVIGTLIKYTLQETTSSNKGASVGLGGYYRFGDAIIPAFQVEWASFALEFSYDINASELSGASGGKGGFELSLKYISQKPIFGSKSKASFF